MISKLLLLDGCQVVHYKGRDNVIHHEISNHRKKPHSFNLVVCRRRLYQMLTATVVTITTIKIIHARTANTTATAMVPLLSELESSETGGRGGSSTFLVAVKFP